MGAVSAQIVLRLAAVTRGPETPRALLARVGLTPDLDPARALEQTVEAEAYYDLLERAAGPDDHGLPFRYAASVTPDDYGAMGLAVKTASTVEGSLRRLARYVLVLTDSLAYELRPEAGGASMVLRGRPHHRRGACLANEAGLAAITSLMRQIAASPVQPTSASFRHPRPASSAPHEAFFGCPVRFGAPDDALAFDAAGLAATTRLGDAGLSDYLLAHLEAMRARRVDQGLEARVRREVMDSLCDGPPSRARIARRLGVSERTLARRLADEGLTFREVADRARREVAESLLARPEHALAEVAFLTGFADQSAFQRAFKRWSGRTPQAFRQGL